MLWAATAHWMHTTTTMPKPVCNDNRYFRTWRKSCAWQYGAMEANSVPHLSGNAPNANKSESVSIRKRSKMRNYCRHHKSAQQHQRKYLINHRRNSPNSKWKNSIRTRMPFNLLHNCSSVLPSLLRWWFFDSIVKYIDEMCSELATNVPSKRTNLMFKSIAKCIANHCECSWNTHCYNTQCVRFELKAIAFTYSNVLCVTITPSMNDLIGDL